MSSREGEESEADQPQGADLDASTEEFFALVAAMPWLVKQYFADSVNLLHTEGRLALRSLIMIAALTLCLAGLIAGSWLVLVVLGVYAAMESGVPLWGIALGVIVLHIGVFAALAKQMMTLTRYLLFPNSRRTFGLLVSRSQPPEP